MNGSIEDPQKYLDDIRNNRIVNNIFTEVTNFHFRERVDDLVELFKVLKTKQSLYNITLYNEIIPAELLTEIVELVYNQIIYKSSLYEEPDNNSDVDWLMGRQKITDLLHIILTNRNDETECHLKIMSYYNTIAIDSKILSGYNLKIFDELLKINKCIRGLDMSDSDLGITGFTYLSGSLVSDTCLIKTLVLSGIGPCLESMRILSDALKINKSIEKLNMSDNRNMGVERIRLLSEALEVNKTIRHLDLVNSAIDGQCMDVLSKSLMINTSVKILDIGFNREFGNAGLIALSNALKTNSTIEEVYVPTNSIGDEGVIEFAKVLTYYNRSVNYINVFDNLSISREGYTALVDSLETNININNLIMNRGERIGPDGRAENYNDLNKRKDKLLYRNRRLRLEWYPRTHDQCQKMNSDFSNTINDMLTIFECIKKQKRNLNKK